MGIEPRVPWPRNEILTGVEEKELNWLMLLEGAARILYDPVVAATNAEKAEAERHIREILYCLKVHRTLDQDRCPL